MVLFIPGVGKVAGAVAGLPWGKIGRGIKKVGGVIGDALGYGSRLKEDYQRLTEPRYDPFEMLDKGPETKAYLDATYPGTTPWEQLGSTPGAVSGGAPAADRSSQRQASSARGAQRTQVRVAETQAAAQVRSSEISAAGALLREATANNPQDAHLYLEALRSGAMPVTGARGTGFAGVPDERLLTGQEVRQRDVESRGQRLQVQSAVDQGQLELNKLRLEFERWALRERQGVVATEVRGIMNLMEDMQSDPGAFSRLGAFGAGAATAAVGGAVASRLPGPLRALWRRFQRSRGGRQSQR